MSIVNRIKNLLTARLALLCCLVGTAGPGLAENKVYIESFSIQPGEQQTVAVCLESGVELRSLTGTITMPAGLEVLNQSTEEDSYTWITTDANRVSAANAVYNPDNGYVKISGFGTTISTGKGTLAYIVVKATEELADGSKITLSGFTAKDKDRNSLDLATADATVTTGQTPQLSFSPETLSLLPGATGQVEVQLENSMALTGFQATVAISEGLALGGVPVKSERLNGDIIPNLETMSVMFLGTVAAGSGTVMTVPIKAEEGFTSGTVTLSGIVVTTASAKAYYPQDIVLQVTVDDGSIIITRDGSDVSVTVDEAKGTPKAGVIADGLAAKSLSYKRTLPAGQACTVCLPYAPAMTGVKFYELTGAEGETLTFTEVASPAAATPYVAVAEAATDIAPATAENVTLTQAVTGSSAAGGYTLKGTLTGLANAEAASAGAYILQAGDVWKKVTTANTDAYIPPFRAYIVGGSAARLGTVLGETTAIGSLRTVDLDGTENWYDLGGRRIGNATTKGVYIVNGKKILK